MNRKKALQLRKDIMQRVRNKDADCESVRSQLDQRYPVCGITVLAPDDSLTDDVCRLCEGQRDTI